ncbi:MAG TPA: AAA family ATPase [Candidatus Baltobacteraceae bacterium]|nr:AAA family ATPase [Candidatus Baltobacteraceae bacterium]
MISPATSSDVFVGRHEELEVLRSEFRLAREGRTRFVPIEGEAGIGKSRLLHEFARGLESDATVAWGHSPEQIRRPYLPFLSIIDAISPRKLLPKVREGRPNAEEKAAYFESVGAMLRRESTRKPAIAILEDVHWADEASIELLRYLAQTLGDARVLFLVTLRVENAATDPALAALRLTLSRARATTIALHGLRRNELKHLIVELMRARRTELPPETCAQIEQLSDGNPLFAEELTRIASENGDLVFGGSMPLSAQATLSERLAMFSEGERDILVRAAIVGQTFDVDFVAAIAGTTAGNVLSTVQRAVSRGVLLTSEESPLCFTFRHALIREALADQLVLALAAPLHVRIAEAIEREPQAEARAAELAYHYSQARIADKARFYNELAGRAAVDVSAYRDAIRFYSAALKWAYPPGPERAALYERLGTLLWIEGVGEEPARWFGRCREEHERLGNLVGVSHALQLIADQGWVDARTADSLRAASESASMLERLGKSELAAHARLSIARFAITLGNAPQALAHIRAAARMQSGMDAATQAVFHEVRAETRAALGDTRGSLSDCRRAARFAAQTGLSDLIAQVENNCALVAADLGELDLAIEHHRVSLDEAHRTGLMWRIGYSAINYAQTRMLKGEYTAARALATQALECGVTTATFKTRAASVGIPLALLLNDRALLAACTDETALELADRSREIQRIASVSAAFAELRCAQGSALEGQEIIGRALHGIPSGHRCWNLWFQSALAGRPEHVALARTVVSGSSGRPRMLRAHNLVLAAVESRDVDRERSVRLAQAAARAFATIGYRWHAAFCTELAGNIGAARAEFVAMGAVRDVQRLSEPVAGKHSGDLTARQRQIAELVALGETNRGIAGRLHISEHTVEHHLSGIFMRLNIKSRAQLTALVVGETRDPAV